MRISKSDVNFIDKTMTFLNGLTNDELRLLKPMLTKLIGMRRDREAERIEKLREQCQKWFDKT